VLRLATALVAVSLLVSPTLAKTKVPAAPAVCTTADQAVAEAGDQVLKRFDGAEAKKFIEQARPHLDPASTPLPLEVDTVLALKRKGDHFFFGVFVKGCYKGMGISSTKRFPELFDDGSI
jgi:hypothetical protein